jgi:hypothetical protein
VLTAKLFARKVLLPRFLGQPPNEAEIGRIVDQELPPLFDYLEREVGGNRTLAGPDFSIGDIGIATQFVNLRTTPGSASMRPAGRGCRLTSTASRRAHRSGRWSRRNARRSGPRDAAEPVGCFISSLTARGFARYDGRPDAATCAHQGRNRRLGPRPAAPF